MRSLLNLKGFTHIVFYQNEYTGDQIFSAHGSLKEAMQEERAILKKHLNIISYGIHLLGTRVS